VAALFEDL